jgi:polyhydroxyalkanoate synthesis regulator phasin
VEQQTAQVAFDLMELIPFFATAGGVFATYLAFGRWIKAWIIEGLINKEKAEQMMKEMKKEIYDEIERIKEHNRDKFKEAKEYTDQECNEIKNDHVEKNTKWLREMQPKVDNQALLISGLQEAINGIRERLREGR